MTDAELRELDSRVHREVMGVVWDESRCRVCGWPIVPEGGSGCWASNCSLRPSPIIRADAVPEYSSDIAAAWKTMRGEHNQWEIKCDPAGWGHVTIYLPVEGQEEYEEVSWIFENLDQLPRAICEARLRSVAFYANRT
jgi:hypothetical protein